ncbi:T9SS type A sorting domain-containing protein [Chryseobacterium sp. JV558]|uniref:T9SS type A sorting domain-containing protein n=1 Tax=Chryseobacterium sp. JV558 TaxID=2663236 RepID=UPI00299DB8F2|nr:T9SS type A sorting domain-containing protein [Chryseobacterium sp. JV558]MDW9379211.1 T9SS type A sorting domain-containing protein [Chryseobacterium sp. JV558]
MKTKEYEFIKRHFVLLDSATGNLCSGIPQRCFKKVNRVLLCSALITAFSSQFSAQSRTSEPVNEKPYPADKVISLYGKERNSFSGDMQRRSSNTIPIELRSKEIREVLIGQDYFSADLFLNEGAKVPSGHNPQVHHYDSQNVVFDGQKHENVRVDEIIDQYTLKNADIDYYYDNAYYLFRDASGNTIASVYYIDRTVGFLKSEYKVVNKGKSLVTFPLLVAPNPAKNVINITYHVEKESQASLQIIDINGRTADTVFRDKQIKNGRHTIQHNINLPAGNYLVQFNAQGQAPVTQKIIVQ